MSALRVLGPTPADLQLVRVPRPGGRLRPLGADEVAVHVLRVGLCGTDVEIVAGCMAYFTSGVARYPVTLGHEWVGEVAAMGAAAAAAGRLALGDRVVGECSVGCRACAACGAGTYHRCGARRETGIMNLDGGAAEVVALPVHALHRIARRVPLALAALAEPAAVALNGVRLGGVAPGKLVAVVGDGPIGLLLLLIACASGADAVVVAGADSGRLALAGQLGAAAVVDVRECRGGGGGGREEGEGADAAAAAAAAAVAAAIRAAAGGRAPDVVLEASGAAAGVRAAVAAAAPGATVVLQGLCGGGEAAPGLAAAALDRIVVNDLTLRGAVGSPGLWPAAVRLLEGGRLDAAAALVTHELPLADFARALELVRTRAAVKVLLLP